MLRGGGRRRLRGAQGVLRSLTALAVVLATVVAGLMGLAPLARAATSYTIDVSASPNRSSPVNLDGSTQTGYIYVFTTPDTNVSQVDFYVDDPTMANAPYHIETWAPMDLAGGSATAAKPFDTTTLTNGTHTITAKLTASGVDTAVTATFTVSNSGPPPQPTYSLLVSGSPDRSSPVKLAGTTQSGDIYVFTSPDTNVTQVDFFVDDPTMAKAPYHTETYAPMDLAGGSATAANPYSTYGLAAGSHTITAKLTLSGGSTVTVSSTFSVDNSSTAPQPPQSVMASAGDQAVYLTWKAGAGASGYNVFRATTSPVATTGTPLNGSTPITGLTFNDVTVTNGVTYHYVVQSVGSGGLTADAPEVTATPQAPQPPTGPVDVKVNFATSTFVPPTGYFRDFGEPLAQRTGAYQGGGAYTYGWVTPGSDTPLSLVGNGRDRSYTGQSDPRLAGFIHMQGGDIKNFSGVTAPGAWELLVPDGWYDVTVAVGDAGTATDSNHTINIEDQNAIWRFQPTATNQFATGSATVHVTDGYLTIDPTGGTNTKLDYLTVATTSSTAGRPSVTQTTPGNAVASVRRDAAVSGEVDLPNVGAGIDPATITSSTVQLIDTTTGQQVPAHANTTGGGDAIVLQPDAVLDALKTYRFVVTSGLKDTSGAAFLPWTSVFTTGTAGAPTGGSNASFDQLPQATSQGTMYTSVTIGPDHRLYAASLDGNLYRFPINADGTLGARTTISTIVTAEGARNVVGLVFAPGSTAANPTLYVSTGADAYSDAPDWSGEIDRLTGADLTQFQKVVVGLPRSVADHETNSLVFGPDGAMYVGQGSMSSMGAPDTAWGMRPEHVLSAAILRLDLTKLPATLPLDVKTADGGGSYNPFATGAPLTIYASGLRNAYDLVWASNGSLYAPTNGASAGGNTPATPSPLPAACASRIDAATNGAYTGPSVPALTNVPDAQDDFLFRVVKGGYYGHPDPARCEWVLNGGNPTSGVDNAEVPQYPVGTLPDRNWHPAVFDFGRHYSPDGAIQYQSNTFNGALKGQLLVVRYSAGDDIIALSLGADGSVTGSQVGIPGFTGFSDPVDLTEDTGNGFLYVSEMGNKQITLLRPTGTTTGGSSQVSVSTPDDAALGLPGDRLVFSTVNSLATPAKAITVTNKGTAPLTVSNIAITGTDATSYRLASGQATSLTIAPGASATVSVLFTPTAPTNCPTSSTGSPIGNVERYATLTFSTNDPGTASASVNLGGLNACSYEGNYEPVLAQVFRALGYTTKATNTTSDVRFIGPKRTPASSDEVQVPYFTAADPSKPVTLSPVAHYSGRDTATSGFGRTGWYLESAPVKTPCTSTDGCNQLFLFPGDPTNGYAQNQKLMPVPNGTTTFTPTGPFGLWTGDYSDINFSDDGKNVAHTTTGADISPPHYLHNLRIYRAYGPGHTLLAHTWLVAVDITRVPSYKNNDFQDLVFVLHNADAEVGQAAAPGSATLSHDLTTGGTVSSTCAVTGFSGVLPNTAGNQCNAANIKFGTAGLSLTSTAGQMGGSNNNQQNALYDLFDATQGPFTVTARVVGPVKQLTGNYQQIGAWFGFDQDNYVKVEAEHNGAGTDPHLTMFYEEKGVAGTVATVSLPALTTASTLDLIIKGNTSVPDPIASTSDPNGVRNYPLDEVTVSYSINGGTPVQVGTVKMPTDVTRWFSTSAKAGILVSGGGSTTPFTATFSRFAITAG